MTVTDQTSTRSKDEVRIFAPWAYCVFGLVFVTITVLFATLVDMKGHAFPLRCLLGAIAGTALGCYAVLIGYINQDAGFRNMSRLLWTLIAIFVPNGLGILLYFVLRKPRSAHCPQCNAEVDPGFSYCPSCRNPLKPVCPHCQHAVGFGDKFCPYCGGSLEPSIAVTVQSPSQSQ
jgi:hypothetical protein